MSCHFFDYSYDQIDIYCDKLIAKPANVSNPEYQALAKIFREAFSGDDCLEFSYKQDVEELQADDTPLARNFRPWFYQTCSEFGWYQTTDSQDQPFGTKSPVDFYVQFCKDVFGDVFADVDSEKNMQHTNMIYGGFNPAVTNVYFTHGSLDPWHPMGVLSDLNEHSPSAVIDGSFCIFSQFT